jgi:acyl-phosphate glycerol-3-phosphate acyltransferase
LIVAVFTRYSSLAALAAAVFAPFYDWLGSGLAWRGDMAMLVAVVVISALVVWRHRQNIRQLLNGKEGRIGGKR